MFITREPFFLQSSQPSSGANGDAQVDQSAPRMSEGLHGNKCQVSGMRNANYTHNSLDSWRRHLQREAGRARVPTGQLVRQFGSGQRKKRKASGLESVF